MNQCPQCKNQVDPSMNVCPYCGFDLRRYFSSQPSAVQIPQNPPPQNPQTPPNYPPPPQNYPSPSYSSTPSYSQNLPHMSQEQTSTDIPFFFGIAGTVLGVVNLCSWLLPCVGCPLSLLGIGLSAYGLNAKNKILAIIGISLNSITFLISLVNSILGVIMMNSSN